MKIKLAKTIDEQIAILKSRNLKIEDENFAKQILRSSNYYTLSGYLFPFLENGIYCDNISFNKLYQIYICDKRVKSTILYAMDIVEHNLKTIFSYNMAHNIDSLCYLDSSNFICTKEHNILIDKFKSAIKRNEHLPFVAHHISHYNSTFPIWVAFNLFTLGMILNLYKNSITPIKKMLANNFNTGIKQLESWIECVVYLRNLCAHYMRIYDFNLPKTPKFCRNHFQNFNYTHKLFDILYVMKFLMPETNEWNNYIIPAFSQIFDEFYDSINMKAYGFPDNWEKILRN